MATARLCSKDTTGRIAKERDRKALLDVADRNERHIRSLLRFIVLRALGECDNPIAEVVRRTGCKSAEAKKIIYDEDWTTPLRMQTIFQVCEGMNIGVKAYESSDMDSALKEIALVFVTAKINRDWPLETLSFESGISIPTLRKVVNYQSTHPDCSLRQVCIVASTLEVPFDLHFYPSIA